MLLAIHRDDPVVRLEGELDASNAQYLEGVLEPEARRGGVVTVDLDGLEFLDASGVGVIVRTARRLKGRGRLVLCRPSGPVRRVLDVVQADRQESLEVVEHSPQEVLRDLFAALARCDLHALEELVSDDAIWHLPGNHAFSGDHAGKDGILALAARMQEHTAELLLDVDEVVAANAHVAVVGNMWGDREGKILFGAGEVVVFRVEGAKVVEGWTYVFDTTELDRFWS